MPTEYDNPASAYDLSDAYGYASVKNPAYVDSLFDAERSFTPTANRPRYDGHPSITTTPATPTALSTPPMTADEALIRLLGEALA